MISQIAPSKVRLYGGPFWSDFRFATAHFANALRSFETLDIVCLMELATRPITITVIARIMQTILRPLFHNQTLSNAASGRTPDAERRALSTPQTLVPSWSSGDAGAELDTRTSFGAELAPTPENIRTQFRRLREMSSQFDEAAAMWQSAATQFAAALQAARKANACKAAIESLEQSLSECEATAARLSIKHHVAEAILAIKQLGPRPWPYLQLIAQANHFLTAAIERHHAYAHAATRHTTPIEGFDMALRDIDSVAQQLRHRLPATHPCALAAGLLHDLALTLRTDLAAGIANHRAAVPTPQRMDGSLHYLTTAIFERSVVNATAVTASTP